MKEPTMHLPIDYVPNTDPPRFRWRTTVDTPGGRVVQEQEGTLPPSIERAVERLVTIARQLLQDNAQLRGQVEGMSHRIADQSELLAKKAEVAPVTTRKGK